MKRLVILFFFVFGIDSYAQTPVVKWWYDIKDASFGQTAAADIDNDGKLELAFSTYRNDSFLHVLNAENGSLKWKRNVGGCADAAPLIYDVDQDGDYEIILAGSCNPVTFCFDADSGSIQWQTPMKGADSPPTIADVDNDGKLEILHGQFEGYVISINAENGSVNWNFQVDTGCWVQTEPVIMDVDKNGQLDFAVATWSFSKANSAIYAFKGNDHMLLWKQSFPTDVMYHGAAFGDIDKDGKMELVLGDYAANLYCVNAENGSIAWRETFSIPGNYIGAPVTLADLNNDKTLEAIVCDAYYVRAIKNNGDTLWNYKIPGSATAFRGVAVADINNDLVYDITFGTSNGMVISIDGLTGQLIKSFNLAAHYGKTFDIDNAPIIADFDNDGVKDVFIVGGHAEYPAVQNNYGRAYCLSWGVGKGPDWTMFRHDERRSACLCDANGNPIPPLSVSNSTSTIQNVEIFPNPAKNIVSLKFQTKEPTHGVIIITDMLGKNLLEQQYEQNNIGQHVLELNTSDLANGIYTISILSKYDKLNIPLTVLK
ncbi:MAG: VCBS repeat-containing protein [Bacteroidetes bacterium]|nr:VCBS repeat-containing protein [Bacteroidota bacterium]